eukprot:scaffold146679_cov15-Tisochrysis_lutea.AAC.1
MQKLLRESREVPEERTPHGYQKKLPFFGRGSHQLRQKYKVPPWQGNRAKQQSIRLRIKWSVGTAASGRPLSKVCSPRSAKCRQDRKNFFYAVTFVYKASHGAELAGTYHTQS